MQSDPAHGRDDELVEKIAREIYSQEYDPEHYPFERLEECEKVLCRKQARAALAVARPAIREECARVAKSPHHSGCNCFYCYGREHAVDAIRSME